ncbi:DUF262 domain-containing protein [Microcystis aeruginosa]|jgi:hypothetical protein|uniref:DUF262 domain-containing protein n=1 Tax=Microcystis aeruginosa TaxID=1126 RepID=UPI00232F51B9|nr:DUF262 domain-containing protein [Microcystis aeruginosa]MDB9411276.1 DUF262 domain-containing protein [Microcystis aeruginosa CS-567/02]
MNEIFKIQMHESKTLSWWNSRRSQIDFDPPYQRKGGLWSDQDKAYLIDSILNGFDIPKLYLADYQFGHSALNQKKLAYAIIDGKQRLEAVFDFFDSKIALDKRFIWRKDRTLSLGGLTLRDLRSRFPSVSEEFENASLTIMSVFTDNDELINELFVRLNRSKSLTGAEVRNAMPGMVPDVIRRIASHVVFWEVIKFSTNRAGDANAAAKILLFEYYNVPVGTKKKDLDGFAMGADVNGVKLELAARRTIDTLDEMRDVFVPNDVLLSSAGIFPVYYWFVRTVDPIYHGYMRPFLVEFEKIREANRKLQTEVPGSNGIIEEYIQYDTFNRSTNDAGSNKGRVSILLTQFSAYLTSMGFGDELKRANLARPV